MLFGEILKKLRVEKGYSQDYVATKIGKSKTVVSGYENNLYMPTLDTLIRIAFLYNVSLDYLVGISKKDSIEIEDFSDDQKLLLKKLADEFNDSSGYSRTMTPRQHEILDMIFNEFLEKQRR